MGGHLKNFFLVSLLILLLSGCVFLHPNKSMVDGKNNFINHYSSCGPESIERALNILSPGSLFNRADVSISIQETGNFTRIFLSLIHYKALEITWPSEIRGFLEKNGYTVEAVDKIEDLRVGVDVAVVLVSNSIIDMHWFCFPDELYILDTDYKHGKVLYIFKITKIKLANKISEVILR